jgi:hypothetical protein
MSDDFDEAQSAAQQVMGANVEDRSLRIPSVGNVASRGKAFIQTADHSVRSLSELVALFDSSVRIGGGWFDKYQKRMAQTHGENHDFVKALRNISPHFLRLRGARNAVEHPEPSQRVVFQDFRLKADNRVYVPSIEVIHLEHPMPEDNFDDYAHRTIEMLVAAFEALMLHLCVLNVQPFAGTSTHVIELDTSERRYPNVRFSYAGNIGGQLVPYMS